MEEMGVRAELLGIQGFASSGEEVGGAILITVISAQRASEGCFAFAFAILALRVALRGYIGLKPRANCDNSERTADRTDARIRNGPRIGGC